MSEEALINKLYQEFKDVIDAVGGVEEAIQQAKMKYGISDRRLLIQLFLYEKVGNAVVEKVLEDNKDIKPLGDFKPEEKGRARIVFALPVREYTYSGCPVCFRKIDDACPKHLEKPTTLLWREYEGGDETLTLRIKVTPRVNYELENRILTGKRAIVFGQMKRDDRTGEYVFMVNKIERFEE